MASFNVPCPSCENSVLIKSDAMIGKKTECPKCKYRFKVEEPSGDDGGKVRKKTETKKAAKKSKGGSGMLVGGLLGVLALGLLAVGAYFLFFNNKDDSSANKGGGTTGTSTPSTPPPGPSGGTPDEGGPDAGNPTGGPGAANPARPGRGRTGASDKDITNLLPGETTSVFRVNIDRISQTPLYTALFDRNTLDFFKNSLAFEVGDIETYIHCVVGPDRHHYDIFRLKKPLDEGELLRKYDQTKGPQSPIKSRDYRTFKSNAVVHALGRALSTETLRNEIGLRITEDDRKRWSQPKPSAYCLLDAYTLIISEESTLERFLFDLTPTGYPPYRTELTSPDTAAPDTGSPGPGDGFPGEGGPGGPPMGPTGPGTGNEQPGLPPGRGPGGRPGGPGGVGGDREEDEGVIRTQGRGGRGGGGGRGGPPGGQPPGGGPGGGQATPPPAAPIGGPGGGQATPPPAAPIGGPGGRIPGGPPDEVNPGGGPGGQPQGRPARRNYTSIPTYRTVDESIKAMLNRLEEDERNPPFAIYAEKLDRLLYNQYALQALSLINQDTVLGGIAGLLQNANVIGGSLTTFARDRFKGSINFSYNTAEDARNSVRDHISRLLVTYQQQVEFYLGTRISIRSGNQTIVGVPPPGAAGGGPGGGDAVGGPGAGIGGPTGPGTGGPTGPGIGGPPPGVGGPPPGVGGPPGRGGPPPGGFPGEGGPGTGSPDGGFGGPGFPGPGTGGGRGGSQSVIDIAESDRFVNVGIELFWNEESYRKNVFPLVAGVANQLKGRMAVLSGETSWHDLAAGFPKLTAAKRPFPRGTAERDPRPERFGMAFPPEQRASFFVDLLPFIGKGGLRNKVQEKKFPWYAKENLPAAEEWVPEFLVPYYPQNSWRAFHPLAENHVLGATNFVALAGLGLDAGRYNPANPDHAKKVGIAGYDFGSKPEEITDGLANTIYLIQVKPGFNRPWIAGGGATVMAVDDKAANPIEDFAHTTPDNKRGTYVLMADGSVRWVADTVDKNVFLGMVTRAGGESLADLDSKAPKVAGSKKEVEIKGGGGQRPLPGSAGGDSRPEQTKVDPNELQKFQGSWKVTFAVMKGQKMPTEALEAAEIQMKIDGTRVDMIMKTKTDEDHARIMAIDATAKPKSIDMKGDKDKNTELGLYEFATPDKVKLRVATDGAKRPTELRIPDEGSKDSYLEMERIK